MNEFVAGFIEDGLNFLAAIASSALSWPVAFVVAIAVFHRPVRDLIGRVKSGKVAGVEFEIREKLEDAGEAAVDAVLEASEKKQAQSQAEKQPGLTEENEAEAPQEADKPAVSPPLKKNASGYTLHWEALLRGSRDAETGQYVYDLVPKSQAAAIAVGTIVKEYGELEKVIRDLHVKQFGDAPHWANPIRMILPLVDAGVLNTSFLSSFEKLRQIRNEVAHGQAVPTLKEAQEFAATAAQLQYVALTELDYPDGPDPRDTQQS